MMYSNIGLTFRETLPLTVRLCQVEEVYGAMRTLEETMLQEENHIKLKLQPGQIVCLRNEVPHFQFNEYKTFFN